ncbi:hypothetical protein NPIL_699171 [Nephila pilipes]|uniref:Uncharacterized protein n=1 Tax=Nephila pilipes TaxID=299642 RepID=A0A8X6NF64_NEPPI|nr:hypothetical protein NPIL_699171 [Nephila pilipes]
MSWLKTFRQSENKKKEKSNEATHDGFSVSEVSRWHRAGTSLSKLTPSMKPEPVKVAPLQRILASGTTKVSGADRAR